MTVQNNISDPIMKKYYQLALVIISLVSVVTLLFYRHEYYRLRYVLEVLNFFGKPGHETTPPDICGYPDPANVADDQLIFNRPESSWQRLSESHFVYSASWDVSDQPDRVKAISVSLQKPDPQLACQLWYEEQDYPFEGKFDWSVVEMKEKDHSKEGKGVVLYLYCKPVNVIGIPFGVTFFKTDDAVPFKPFIPVNYVEDKDALANSTALCVSPNLRPGLQKSTIIEFLSYHYLLGISNFIIYDNGLPNKLISTLISLAVKKSIGLNVSLLRWNFPFPSENMSVAIRVAMETDCIIRGTGLVRSIAILRWEEYIVPRYHHLFATMLDDFDSGRKTTSRFEIPAITICSDLPDDERSKPNTPLVLRKTHYTKATKFERPFYVYRPRQMSNARELAMSTQRVSQGIAAVHSYVPCESSKGMQGKTTLYEPAMLRFAGDLLKSKLFKIWQL